MRNLGPHTVTVVKPGEKPDDYGPGSSPDWDNTTDADVPGCSVQPAPADEFTVDRDTFLTRYVAYCPPSIDVSATDRIRWQGQTYDIDGDVLRWDFPPLDHVVLNLRRSTDA